MSRSLYAICIAALLGAAATVPATAQNYESRVVTYGELDLNSSAGADTLIRRIDNAAETVCGDRSRNSARLATSERQCEAETEEYALADVNHPLVTARYYGSGYAVVEEGSAYYDPRLDPASPHYDARLDPNSPYYAPPPKY
jgi:UrcA family protein